MMRKAIKHILLAIIMGQVSLFAQGLLPSLGGQRVSTSAFSFLKIDPSATSSGLRHASVALARDASAMHWNPAALVRLPGFSLTASHLSWFTDINYDYAAATIPLSPNTSIGLDAGILHMTPMEVTTEYEPYGSGEWFTFQDLYFSLAWSQKMSDRFSFGISAKYIEESYLNYRTQGLLMDLGTYYLTGYKDLRIAVSLLNFGSPVRPEGSYEKTDLEGNVFKEKYEEFSPPTSFQLSAAMTVLSVPGIDLLTLFQLNHPVDNAETYVFAVEAEVLKSFAFRAGYDISDDTAPLSFGIGFYPAAWKKGLSIDYAIQEHPYLQTVQQVQVNIFMNR